MKYLETDKSFYIKLVKIALPIAMQSVITTGVNLVDTIMLGALGETALSSSSLATQFITVFTFMCMGISMGSSVLTSRFWGADNQEALHKVITIAIRFCLGLGIIFTIINACFPSQIMALYTNDPLVIDGGTAYLRWSTATYLLTALSTVTTNILRSTGRSGVPLTASALSFAVNIGANYIFIFGKFGAPAMGVAGAALGTVIARIVEFSVNCAFFFFFDKKIHYHPQKIFSRCGDMVNEFFRVSIPVMFSDSLLGVGDSVLAMIMGRIGSDFVAANSITNAVQRVTTIFITGISFAGCFIIGQTLGEGQADKVKRQSNTMLFMGILIGCVASILMQILSGPIINYYNISDSTALIAHKLMNAISLIIIFRSTNSILTKGVLRGGGDTRFLFLIDSVTMWGLAIPLGYVAGLVLNLDPFWICLFLHCDQIVKAFWSVKRLQSGKWIKKVQGDSL
ncbi:MAG: MATE family efflux transporter [Lachnospiraceae bacterium]|nr:MATE family efflux transporter [Lachnospiraceae bacterium]